ncbi:predicted protein [Phaeodactylum tricornutum CCAP 1055/1]|uniref:Uncharacterized protein n=1 Tax=Phaeodactylum tricornutum (strain CCAP 1055/1) TaxID=556484 RepID=B7G011_PHATC|nr:predicted protein [Phaeodactylum tricornutum CCAP 1055/1]EEC48006.1 predicted protein [Phaeodactylum tricornutum CCAP 1055/1]|eukprot:XP_002180598.1 predicted protein [Phaeodactylum tricornutum CCAP 1055/1]
MNSWDSSQTITTCGKRHAILSSRACGRGVVPSRADCSSVPSGAWSAAYSAVSWDFDGAVQQLLQLSPHRKTLLVRSVQTVLTSAGATVSQFQSPTLFRAALLQFVSQQQVRDQIWRACVDAMHAPENVE